MKAIYTAVVTAQGGREGRIISNDGILDTQLKSPKEMARADAGTNPEQLFAGGYAACFESALRAIAKKENKTLTDASITAHVTLNMIDESQYKLSVELHGKIKGFNPDDTMHLMEKAHQVCPYSKATRDNIDVKLFAD